MSGKNTNFFRIVAVTSHQTKMAVLTAVTFFYQYKIKCESRHLILVSKCCQLKCSSSRMYNLYNNLLCKTEFPTKNEVSMFYILTLL